MTLVKISGITTWRDAEAAVDAGADALGFACDEYSPRLIDPETFSTIDFHLPAHIHRVGMLGATTDALWRMTGTSLFGRFHQIQYTHDSFWTDILRQNWDMRRKIREFPLTSERDLRKIAEYNGLVQAFLLNVHAPEGESYSWDLAREVHQYGKRLYITGGLTADNVAQAILRVRPFAVDVTVGVEVSPGVKDAAKMRDFVQAVRALE